MKVINNWRPSIRKQDRCDCRNWRDVAGGVRDCVTSVVRTACYMNKLSGIPSSLSALMNVTDCLGNVGSQNCVTGV